MIAAPMPTTPAAARPRETLRPRVRWSASGLVSPSVLLGQRAGSPPQAVTSSLWAPSALAPKPAPTPRAATPTPPETQAQTGTPPRRDAGFGATSGFGAM